MSGMKKDCYGREKDKKKESLGAARQPQRGSLSLSSLPQLLVLGASQREKLGRIDAQSLFSHKEQSSCWKIPVLANLSLISKPSYAFFLLFIPSSIFLQKEHLSVLRYKTGFRYFPGRKKVWITGGIKLEAGRKNPAQLGFEVVRSERGFFTLKGFDFFPSLTWQQVEREDPRKRIWASERAILSQIRTCDLKECENKVECIWSRIQILQSSIVSTLCPLHI